MIAYIARGGQIMFQIAIAFEGDQFTLTEQTPQDRLEMRLHMRDGVITERVTVNDDDITLRYPVLQEEALKEAHQKWRSGGNSDPEIASVFDDFERFYRRNYPETLHGNDMGRELVRVVLQYSNDVMEVCGRSCLRLQFSRWFCAISGVATGLKCLFGGPFNPLCDLGTIHQIACGLFFITIAVTGG